MFDETALLGHSGSCDLDLGRPDEAIDLLQRQDAASAELFVRNRAIWRIDQATAYRDLGELASARIEADSAAKLVDTTSSTRTRHKLRDLQRSLAVA